MESHNIEKLLEKYFEATTTVTEEENLRKYFTLEEIPSHLEQYAPMFQYVSHAKEERFIGQLPLQKGLAKRISVKSSIIRWASVAAVAVLLIGVYFNRTAETTLEETYTQEEIAAAQEAFSLLAINFNKGTDQLSHLDEFEKNTNKFLTK